MPAPPMNAKRLYHRARRIMHAFVDSLAPVTYTDDEIRARKKLLDPADARNDPLANAETDRRVLQMAGALGFAQADARRYLDEARAVRLLPAAQGHESDLASPMCYEDRYALYVIVRAARPETVVETGVAHGVSSAYILAAMHANGNGRLISIELSPDRRVGRVVAPQWRSRWTLRIGDSRSLLPDILHDVAGIDMFIHDSDHTYRHMWAEFGMAWRHVSPGGILCSHDRLTTNALPRFTRRFRTEIDTTVNSVNLGWLRKRPLKSRTW